MKKSIQFAVNFANFCKNENVDPRELGELLTLINRAFKAGEYDANNGTNTADPWYNKVEAQAASFGWKTQWPGLYPYFTKGDKEIQVPCEPN
jgi:hypothetical protein